MELPTLVVDSFGVSHSCGSNFLIDDRDVETERNSAGLPPITIHPKCFLSSTDYGIEKDYTRSMNHRAKLLKVHVAVRNA